MPTVASSNDVAWTEPDEYIQNTTTVDPAIYHSAEDAWAVQIIKQGSVKESQAKLERQISEFLVQAHPAERTELECDRAKILDIMKAAQAELDSKYPEAVAGSMQTRRPKAKAKIKAGCQAFSKVTYEYSQIMDLLACQAPEYVALVWGAIKIVLVVQINHEELKQKVKESMTQIKRKFETIDHLTAYMPKANLVTAVAKAYELFSRFLTKAVKYYSLNRFKATWKAFAKPWKIDLQGLVDEIDQTFIEIRDISHYHGLLEGRISFTVAQENLHNSRKSIAMQEASSDRLAGIEAMLQQVFQATVIQFSKEHDIQQTANFLRQCVDDSMQEPEHSRTSNRKAAKAGEITSATKEVEGVTELADLKSFRDEIFAELRDFHLDSSRREKAIEQTSEMRSHRSKNRNLLRIDKVMAWIEVQLSFAAPLLVLGESNHETILILRHFCEDEPSYQVKSYRLLVQALLFQIFEQHPQIFAHKKASITRERSRNLSSLWDLFIDCLEDAHAHCTFIVIDNIDVLGQGAGVNTEDGRLVIQKLNALVQDQTKLVKVLLTASLAKDQANSSDGRAALMIPRRKVSLASVQDDLPLVPHKFIKIQQKRCKDISFAEITMLYFPNTTVYSVEDGELQAFVVTELSGMEPRAFDSYSPLQLRVWSIDHDGQRIARRFRNLTISSFSGQRAIASLRYVPAGYLQSESKQRKDLVARGKFWWKYSSDVHHVVVGSKKSSAIIDQRSRRMAANLPEEFQDDFSESTDSELKPLYYILCPPFIEAFMLQELQWTVKASDLTEYHDYHVQENLSGLDSVVVPAGHKRTLVALVEAHSRNLVRDNRKGLIILLHGEPGGGKTSTAESVADHTRRPLFQLRCDNISESAEAAEKRLKDYFQLAHKWHCVLLLDEADAILSRRTRGDLKSNAITSLFRRISEYYSGILFLKTNRIDTFDEAFRSRIHLSIYFPKFDEIATILIWKMNIAHTQQQWGKRIEIDEDGILKYVGDYFKGINALQNSWNGHQIRNAFQTAIALAEFEAQHDVERINCCGDSKPRLSVAHFKKVVEASKQFDEYINMTNGLEDDLELRRSDIDEAKLGREIAEQTSLA